MVLSSNHILDLPSLGFPTRFWFPLTSLHQLGHLQKLYVNTSFDELEMIE